MKQNRRRTWITPFLYFFVGVSVLTGAYYIQNQRIESEGNEFSPPESASTVYYEEEIIMPVLKEDEVLEKPFRDENIDLVRCFYYGDSNVESQEKSIVYYENIYTQNKGVDYSSGDKFEVVASLSGEVVEVFDDMILGKVVTIDSGNDIIMSYQSLSETPLKIGDNVEQGQSIGISGVNNLSKELGNHIHIELLINNEYMDPESVYGLDLTEINPN